MTSGLSKKGRLGRLATMFATILLVSGGLCGANLILTVTLVPMSGFEPPTHAQNTFGSILAATGVIELGGMAFGLVSLLAVSIIGIFTYFFGKKQSNGDEP